MSTSQIAWIAVALLLLFWIVGAYNRLVRLRQALVQGFAPVDLQLVQRQGLLTRQIEMLEPLLPHAAERLAALRAACQQLDTARGHARHRPTATNELNSLRLAEEILSDARGRLPVQGVAGVELGELNAALGATDAALAFARGQFNAAVMEYNRSMTQFPTLMIVGLFGFRLAGPF